MPDAAIAATVADAIAAARARSRRARRRASREAQVPRAAEIADSRRWSRSLLVDDRPENLLALEAILEPLGQQLVRASSGDEALRQLLDHDFAVILLDVQMPGINGFETAR